MTDRVDLLVDILYDKEARFDEKDDAIMCLGEINNDRALNALIKFSQESRIVSYPIENDMLLDSCGESIAQIWMERNQVDMNVFKTFPPRVQKTVKMSIIHNKPNLISKFKQ
jgi:HEAT repeat protein